VGLAGGFFLGWRRFILERPHDPAWETGWGEAILRALPGSTPEYAHSFAVMLTNRSLAFQRFEGYWMRVYPYGHADFDEARFDQIERSIRGIREFFGREMFKQGAPVAPGGSVRFGQTFTTDRPYSMVRSCYAAIGRRPRRFLPGYHEDMMIIAFGSQTVSVGLEDLRHAAE
jgi:hypothetical protein